MNWKPLVIGFVAGCIIASIAILKLALGSEPVALYTISVKTVDSDTNLPIKVTSIQYPNHADFTHSSSEPEKSPINRVELGSESGITRIDWVGKGRAEEYNFILSAHGYDDIIVPTDFIETSTVSITLSQQNADVLLMKKQNKP